MNKITTSLITLSLLVAPITSVSAAPKVAVKSTATPVTHLNYSKSTATVIVNDKVLSFRQAPIMVNGSTLVPLRAVAEAFNALVGWDADTQTITIETDQYQTIEDTGETESYSDTDRGVTFDYPKGWFIDDQGTIILTNFDTSKAIGRGGLEDGLVKMDLYVDPNTDNLSFEDLLLPDTNFEDEESILLSTEVVTINGVMFKKQVLETSFEGSAKIVSLETIHNDKHIIINSYAPDGPHQQQALKSIEEIYSTIHVD